MKNKKKLLIAGGSHSDIPLIEAGKKLGFYVVTTGNRPNDLGHKYSDEYQNVDFSNLADMLSLSKRLKIDAICSCCNDFSALTSAYVAEKLGLPGHDSYETMLILHHKDLYRKFALDNKIPTPYAESFDNIKHALEAINKFSLPLIIKPIDLTGGKGVSKIIDRKDFKPAIEKAFAISRAKRIVIEEFINGTQHSFSSFIRNGKVVFHFSDNEYSYINPYLVSTSSTPALSPDIVDKKLITISEKIASLLSLKTGIFHVQYLQQGEKITIIEITRRCPGDLYTKPVYYSTGIDYAFWIVKAEAGMDCSGLPQVQSKGFFGRHCIMSAKEGKVKDIIIDSNIKNNIIDQLMWWKPGDNIDNYLTSKFGIVFLKYDSKDEMINKTQRLNELIRVETY